MRRCKPCYLSRAFCMSLAEPKIKVGAWAGGNPSSNMSIRFQSTSDRSRSPCPRAERNLWCYTAFFNVIRLEPERDVARAWLEREGVTRSKGKDSPSCTPTLPHSRKARGVRETRVHGRDARENRRTPFYTVSPSLENTVWNDSFALEHVTAVVLEVDPNRHLSRNLARV